LIGVGHPVEVTYALPGPIPAGNYHLVGDGVISAMPMVQFDLLWREPGSQDSTIVSFTHQYPSGTAAQYEETKSGAAVAAVNGDLIVLRVTMLSTDPNSEYVPIAEHPPTPTARFLSVDIP